MKDNKTSKEIKRNKLQHDSKKLDRIIKEYDDEQRFYFLTYSTIWNNYIHNSYNQTHC